VQIFFQLDIHKTARPVLISSYKERHLTLKPRGQLVKGNHKSFQSEGEALRQSGNTSHCLGFLE
jgi:hypothetical protein